MANIVGDYNFFGSGVAKGNDNRYYWTQHFARPQRNHNELCLNNTPPPHEVVEAPTHPTHVVTLTVTVYVTRFLENQEFGIK